ncbi:uncharacterized protein EHS24_006130 [Apiotrichum porosum]|uniref:DNA polymerase delta subunit 4 n=1 Tax=Apiotrichum porosum TaxID=105984 RepID=A0A427Y0E6_9TREE|nr:uncharacterized protein EHS24_006130 [Apiotrichum porosum]RSH84606.1 hypothetical protein EHS24_006130 [Apiotrichum porosum]
MRHGIFGSAKPGAQVDAPGRGPGAQMLASVQQSSHRQPTLSFQSRRPASAAAKAASKNKSLGKTPALRRTGSASSLSSVDRAKTPPVKDAAKDDVVSVPDDEREVLDGNSKQWNKLYKDARVEMGGVEPIHAGPQMTKVHHILRVFDMTSKYGPCAGITRLDRWDRAKKLGLNPPEEIRKILVTQQGEDSVDLRESVLYGWV